MLYKKKTSHETQLKPLAIAAHWINLDHSGVYVHCQIANTVQEQPYWIQTRELRSELGSWSNGWPALSNEHLGYLVRE